MTVNELNSKVHLPGLAQHLGNSRGYSYVKVPKFGWFGYNKDLTHIFDILGVFDNSSVAEIYRYITRDRPEFQEYKMHYSEVLENKLSADYWRVMSYRQLMAEAIAATETDRIRVNGVVGPFSQMADELGLRFLLFQGIGLLSPRVINGKVGKRLGLPDKYTNKVLIPTYYTPGHFASLEVASLEKLEDRYTLFMNQEKGWYGELNHTIVGKFTDLLSMRGCTWDSKVDHWNSMPVDLHPTLTTSQCIEIWSKTKNLQTRNSPLEVIKANNGLEEMKSNLKDLTLKQVKELETFTGCKLTNYWTASRSVEADVCGFKFSCRNDRYYLYRYSEEMEYSNFAVKLTKITREQDEFWQQGVIYYNGTETPFRAKRKNFDTQAALMKELNKIFLEAGIGIPSIAPNYKHYITNVITAFNPDVPIEIIPTPAGPQITTPMPELGCQLDFGPPTAPHSQTPSPACLDQPASLDFHSPLDMLPVDQNSSCSAEAVHV